MNNVAPKRLPGKIQASELSDHWLYPGTSFLYYSDSVLLDRVEH